jgi:hypothetical protein
MSPYLTPLNCNVCFAAKKEKCNVTPGLVRDTDDGSTTVESRVSVAYRLN